MNKLLILSVAAIALGFPARADNKSVDNASALCRIIDSTGLSSAPCAVSGFDSAVIATLDMNSNEARDLCAKVSNLMREKGATFSSGWTLQIKSPYSGDSSIAFCPL